MIGSLHLAIKKKLNEKWKQKTVKVNEKWGIRDSIYSWLTLLIMKTPGQHQQIPEGIRWVFSSRYYLNMFMILGNRDYLKVWVRLYKSVNKFCISKPCTMIWVSQKVFNPITHGSGKWGIMAPVVFDLSSVRYP